MSYRRHLMMHNPGGAVLPAWFTEHIVCWHSPKRQGATNESLAADPRLVDLGGKGMDLQLVNFSFTETSGISSDGGLRFDGTDDYARTINPFILGDDFTVMARRKFIRKSHYCLSSKQKNDNSTTFILDIRYSSSDPQVSSFGNTQNDATNPLSRELQWLTPTLIHSEQTIRKGSNTDGDGHLYIGRFRMNDDRMFNGTLYSYLLFNVSLTYEQINWIKNNLID